MKNELEDVRHDIIIVFEVSILVRKSEDEFMIFFVLFVMKAGEEGETLNELGEE